MLACSNQDCPNKPLPLWQRFGAYGIFAAVLLWKPFVNAVGLNWDNLGLSTVVMTGAMAYPIGAFALCIMAAFWEDTSHHGNLFLHGLSIPGFLLGVLLMLSK